MERKSRDIWDAWDIVAQPTSPPLPLQRAGTAHDLTRRGAQPRPVTVADDIRPSKLEPIRSS
jgi:hypothetical protein